MNEWTRLDVWAPAATALFGSLVIISAIADLVKRRAHERGCDRVPGTVLRLVEVTVPSDLHPFAAAVVEYTWRGETRTFQSDTLMRIAHGKHSVAEGDRVTVFVPKDGGPASLHDPGAKAMGTAGTLLLGLAIVGISFVIRFVLTSPTTH